MLKIENVETYGWEAAIRGMRNPKNSWDKSDSEHDSCTDSCAKWDECHVGYHCPAIKNEDDSYFCIGKNDLDLMKRLANAGTDHGKFLRMITVTLDIVAPLYWWKEFDTYKVGTVANSCSTMHKIHAKEFTLDDFSHEHMIGNEASIEDWWHDEDFNEFWSANDILCQTVYVLNLYRDKFIETKDKRYWWQMIQLLPISYNQRRTVQLNYAVLKNIYHARKDHKLDEWHTLCDWIESLPYSELITGRH